MQQIAGAGVSGDCGNILTLRAELLTELNRRAIITGASSDLAASIARLTAEKAALTAQLGTCRQTITVSASGYYYSDCDGFESASRRPRSG